MKDNKKKKDRRKYPQGSAASHAGQNSGNHGGHAGHPRSRSSKLLKNRKTLLIDLVSSKNYEPMRLKDIAMLLQVPKAKRSELAEVMEILVKEGKIDVISDGRYQKSRGASTTTEKREKRDRRAGEQGRRGRDDRFRRKNGKDGDTEKKRMYEDALKGAAWAHQDKVSFQCKYDFVLSNRIYAGCDMFLMPSLFEPCGLSQLMSLRYGTLPIVRETGGLKDTVAPYNEYENTGTGFSFCNYNAHEMMGTVRYAEHVYYDKKRDWNKMVERAMSVDFSWKTSAKKYQQLYDDLIG